MIKKTICPDCQTPNTPGGKFCSNCGSRLPKSTSIICYRCQTPNPSSNFYCDKCGSRLGQELKSSPQVSPDSAEDLPTSAKMFSLPTRKPGETGELTADNVMDWLMSGRTEQPEEEEKPDKPDTGTFPRISELTPQQRGTDADLPGWLFDADNPEPILDAPPDITTAHFLNLIKQIDDDERKKLSGMLTESVAGESGDLPDWLQDFVQSGEEPAKSGASAKKEPTRPPTTDEEEDLDWLTELGPPATGSLSQPLDNTTAAKVMTGDPADLSDWLEELGPADTETLIRPGHQEATTAPQGLSDSVLPDWLDELGPANTDLLAQSPTKAGSEKGDDAGSDQTLPDWLLDLQPDTDALADPLNVGQVAAELAIESESDYPDWLIDPVDTGSLAFPAQVAEESQAKAAPAALTDSDWASDLSDEPEEPEKPALDAWQFAVDEDEDEAEGLTTAVADPPSPIEVKARKTLTDWLAELSDVEPAASPPESAAEAADADLAMDDWLAAETEDDDEDDDEDDEAFLAVGMTGPLPDWLDELAPEAKESSDPEEQAATDDFLDELLGVQTLASDEQAEAIEAEAAPEAAELLSPDLAESEVDADPDWLFELGAFDSAEPVEATAVALPPPPADLPTPESESEGEAPIPDDAFQAIAASANDDDWAEIEDILAGQSAETEFPDWLTQFESSTDDLFAPEDSPADEAETEGETIATGDLPDWIVDLRPDERETGSGLPPALLTEQEALFDLPADFAEADLPLWLQDADGDMADMMALPQFGEESPIWIDSESELGEPSDELAAILAALPPAMPPEDSLTKAEVPDWILNLKPPELSGIVVPQIDLKAETTGPLAGMLGAVRVEPVVAMPRSATPLLPYAVTTEQTQQARLLRQLMQEMETPPPVVPVKTDSHSQARLRSVLALILLATALLAWLMPGSLAGSAPAPLTPAVTAVHTAITAAAGRPVLVAFEYTPALAGELDYIARLLLAELEDNGSLILTTSQYAAGTAVANALTAPYPNQPIGLLVGEAIGLRQLGVCLEENQVACDTLQGRALSAETQAALQEVALVIILTGERTSLVNWVEQVGPATDTPIIAGVTQALAPVAAPYAATGQFVGVLDGLPGVMAYADAFGAAADLEQARAQYGAQGLMQLAAAILLLVGALAVGLARPKPPARGK